MDSLFTQTNILSALGILIGAAVFAFRSLSKLSAEKKEQRLADVLTFSRLAYKVVAEISIRTESKVDDKIALGLAKLNEALEAASKKPLSPEEAKLAALAFTATHGEEKLAEKLSELSAPIIGSPVIASPS